MKKEILFQGRRDLFSKMLMVGTGGLALLSLSGCNSSNADAEVTVVPLTEEQKATVFYMYQEEKVARDVYITLGIEYPDENTFAYIQLSEQRHMDAVETLCLKYGIDISGVDESVVGEFVLPELKTLYDECVAKGMLSLLDALQVGVTIELTDISDIEEAEIGMPNDVVIVFENLKEGSQNHLEAFTHAISQLTA